MKTQRITDRLRRLILAAPAVLLAAGCVTDPLTGKQTVNFYSMQEEIRLGRSALQANTEQLRQAGVPVNRDRERLQQLQRITDRIAAVSDYPDLPYSVTLYHTNIVNAAAAPGGAMFVFEGLYHPAKGLATNETELAVVMAHEIAHVNARHVTERMTKMMIALGIAETAAYIARHNDEDQISDIIRAVFAVGTALYIPVYSRQDEREADRVGLLYMARAGYDPRAAPAIWERVARERDGRHGASIFATHPSAAERARLLRQHLPEALEVYRRATGAALP